MQLTRLIAILLLLISEAVHAFTLPSWMRFPKKPEAFQPAKQRVSVGEFTGGTGSSARKAVLTALEITRELTLTTHTPQYLITGTSIGGRITGRIATAAGKPILDRTYAAPGLDENASAFADDVVYAITGQPGLATSRIVFVSDRSGQPQIYLCDPDGREVLQVTHHNHGAVSPSLNADASAVAYTSYRTGFPVVKWLDLAQGWERTVTDTPGSSFGAAFSPDGQKLALVMSFLGSPEIFVTDLATCTAACVSDTIGVPSSPSWHPDGKRIIFSDDRGDGPRLYVAEVPENSQKEASLVRWRTGYHFCTDPEFSPDGKQVAFTTRLGGELAVAIQGWPNGSTEIIQRGGAAHPTWSPDGRYLCYTHHGNLYLHDTTAGQRRAILEKYGRISEPRWMK